MICKRQLTKRIIKHDTFNYIIIGNADGLFFHGLHRGFVRELVGFLGVLLVLGFALLTTDFFAVCYQAIGNLLVVKHNPVHLSFYRGLGFFSALLIATILVRLLARMLNVVAHVPLLNNLIAC